MTIGELTRQGMGMLLRAGIEQAGLETGWLLEHALRRTPLDLRMNESQPVEGEGLRRAQALLERRANREPLQYLLGTQEFCGVEFDVEPGVLIPRPDTEVLVEAAVRCAGTQSSAGRRPIIADIGTGSGCIAVALARRLPLAVLYATDCSAEALRVARRNADRHGVAGQVTFLEGNLLEPLQARALLGRVNLVISNPPYIAEIEVVRRGKVRRANFTISVAAVAKPPVSSNVLTPAPAASTPPGKASRSQRASRMI